LECFKGYGPEVIVDGLCAPSDASRFCLGIKGSIVTNPVAEAARRQIGKLLFDVLIYVNQQIVWTWTASNYILICILGDGCKMIREGADIHVQCLSDSPIFIQCPLYAASAGDHLATVYRLSKSKFYLYLLF
jgi:hypothetical protein